MKKFLLMLLAFVPMMMMAQSKVIIAGDNVCLRSQPNESSKMTGSNAPHLFTGETYDCLGTVGNYYKIRYNGGQYYLPKQYGRPRGGNGNNNSASSSHPRNIIIAGDNVCLRAQANENSKLTGPNNPHLFTGEVYECTAIVGNYYRILYGGEVYFLPKKYGRPRN